MQHRLQSPYKNPHRWGGKMNKIQKEFTKIDDETYVTTEREREENVLMR